MNDLEELQALRREVERKNRAIAELVRQAQIMLADLQRLLEEADL